MNGMFWICIVVTAIALFGLWSPNDTAMEQCQKTNSYDVCFQQLNR
jgi:hypothetical protein